MNCVSVTQSRDGFVAARLCGGFSRETKRAPFAPLFVECIVYRVHRLYVYNCVFELRRTFVSVSMHAVVLAVRLALYRLYDVRISNGREALLHP